MKAVAPPVGSYNDPRSALTLLRKTTTVNTSPFGTGAMRFTNRKCSTPGQCVLSEPVCVCQSLPGSVQKLFKGLLLFDLGICILQMQPQDLALLFAQKKKVFYSEMDFVTWIYLLITQLGLIYTLSDTICTWMLTQMSEDSHFSLDFKSKSSSLPLQTSHGL